VEKRRATRTRASHRNDAHQSAAVDRVLGMVSKEVLDADDFMVPGTNKQGHFERVNFRILPEHHRQVYAVLGSKQFPYRTLGHLIRHSLVRHMIWLRTLKPGLKSVHAQVDAMIVALKDDEMQADFDGIFSLLRERVAAHQLAGRQAMAEKLVQAVGQQIRGMPEGDWKRVYRRELEQKFGELMPKRAKLVVKSRGKGGGGIRHDEIAGEADARRVS